MIFYASFLISKRTNEYEREEKEAKNGHLHTLTHTQMHMNMIRRLISLHIFLSLSFCSFSTTSSYGLNDVCMAYFPLFFLLSSIQSVQSFGNLVESITHFYRVVHSMWRINRPSVRRSHTCSYIDDVSNEFSARFLVNQMGLYIDISKRIASVGAFTSLNGDFLCVVSL